MKAYQVISRAMGAAIRCLASGNEEWRKRWEDRIAEIVSDFPSGSGFDNGTELDSDSTPERLIFSISYHHMNEDGMYDGWTDHKVIVTPSLEMGYRMRITGVNRNDIKEHIAEQFDYALGMDVEEYPQAAVEQTK